MTAKSALNSEITTPRQKTLILSSQLFIIAIWKIEHSLALHPSSHHRKLSKKHVRKQPSRALPHPFTPLWIARFSNVRTLCFRAIIELTNLAVVF